MFPSIQPTAVGSIDTSGISMLEEVKKNIDRRDLKVQLNSFQSFHFLASVQPVLGY
jgi:hypothetical protein